MFNLWSRCRQNKKKGLKSFSVCVMNLYYMKVSLRCWAAHPHILALLNVFSKMSRVVNKMYALSYAFKWGGVPENVALECSHTRPASPIKKKNCITCCASGEVEVWGDVYIWTQRQRYRYDTGSNGWPSSHLRQQTTVCSVTATGKKNWVASELWYS